MPRLGWRIAGLTILALQLYQLNNAVDMSNLRIFAVKAPIGLILFFAAVGMNLYAFDMTLGSPRLWAVTKYLLLGATALIVVAGLLLSEASLGGRIAITAFFGVATFLNCIALSRLAKRTEMGRI